MLLVIKLLVYYYSIYICKSDVIYVINRLLRKIIVLRMVKRFCNKDKKLILLVNIL